MALYRITTDKLELVPQTSFVQEQMLERRDLQRLLRSDITILGEDLFVLSEEFGEWEESSRRIDLLCLDKQRRLVVVEIKRTEDGGHMELQAIRYASMVSSLTLDQAASTYSRILKI
jgi:RecB family endonuclease NucS